MEQSMITLPPINGFDGFDALIQTWLFFGLLNEILGTLFTPSQFVRTINSQDRPSQVVDTSDLLPVLDVWVKAVQQPGRTKVQKQAQFKHITACLQLTNDVFRGLECNDQLLPNRLIKHSIVSVAEVLFDAAYQAFQSRELPKVPIHWVRFYQDAETSLQLSRHGFCPSEIKRISTHSRLFKPIIV
ncbi:MAG: hypothetical protein L6R37_005547 [Teloschistes peruensis]|nr:MAG: hypothetical protein L6R37_005547 [Teloschistes peruensis]